jgi:hypothetical protein
MEQAIREEIWRTIRGSSFIRAKSMNVETLRPEKHANAGKRQRQLKRQQKQQRLLLPAAEVAIREAICPVLLRVTVFRS